MIDTHVHLYDERFDGDRDDIIGSLQHDGIQAVVCVGCDLHTSKQAIKLASINKNIYASVGLHPHYCKGDVDLSWISGLVGAGKVVALGEFGLDYHYDDYDRVAQCIAFDEQLQLANVLKLPQIIHLRDAQKDCLDILKNYHLQYGGVMHCFGGDASLAKQLLDKGYYISFSGNVTYKNAQCIRDAARFVPLDRLLIETDCPYLAPMPHRGQRNQPKYVEFVAEQIALLKAVKKDAILNATTANAKKLFAISTVGNNA